MLVNTKKAIDNDHYVRNIILQNLKLICILEFLVNTYVFNFWVELFIIPLITFIGLTKVVAEMNSKNKDAVKFLNFLMGISGIAIIGYVSFYLLRDFRNLATVANLKELTLPILLTTLFLPFIYANALWMQYNEIF